jgi:23S rRNA (guanosine2251-2'-O)-methyltransferase
VDRRRIDLDDVVYGIHAVEEALDAGETIRRLHVGDDRKRDPALAKLFERARATGVHVRFEDRKFFTQFPYKAHQSVIAIASPFAYAALDDIVANRRSAGPALLVVLDHITDPHNAGAIIRSAEAAGAGGVVMPERRAAGVNATVRKAAAGAAAHLPIARVANIADALRKLKKAGIWIAGADLGMGSQPFHQADLARDVAIVIGAEPGLSPVARKECDYLVNIPMRGRLDSLNASVAAGILLFEAVRQRSSLKTP